MPTTPACRPRRLPSYAVLERAYRAQHATLPVNRINHREFVVGGIRYLCGYDSRVSAGHPEPDWVVYDAVPEVGRGLGAQSISQAVGVTAP
jgi:hypothetical protein